MAAKNERIASMVRTELAKNPQVSNHELLNRARTMDPKLRRMSARQFHATYRLPALRAAKPSAPPGRRQKAEAPQPAPARAEPGRTEAGRTEHAPHATAKVVAHAPAESQATVSHATASHAPTGASRSTALARPNAAEREAVRLVLQSVAREALQAEERTSFVKLLDSLDERAGVVLAIFGRQ